MRASESGVDPVAVSRRERTFQQGERKHARRARETPTRLGLLPPRDQPGGQARSVTLWPSAGPSAGRLVAALRQFGMAAVTGAAWRVATREPGSYPDRHLRW